MPTLRKSSKNKKKQVTDSAMSTKELAIAKIAAIRQARRQAALV
ncbi:MAG TPA: hypothetical protein VGO47_07990 [Chlamydiales bacterium]|jgi:hypothetical protein|nr:hypothetical protein [Chlamydiales bacterium]